jgi:putative ABC transport system substrate-binding protein
VVAAFREGLAQGGFREGQNMVIAFRWAEGRYDSLRHLATDLTDLRVGVFVAAGGLPAVVSAMEATKTVPIIFTAVSDPVQLGFVESFNRPGGNVTGISLFNNSLVGKRIGLLHEFASKTEVAAMLVNPTSAILADDRESYLTAAQSLGLTLHILNASTERELNAAFATLKQLHVGALVIQGEPFFDSRRHTLVELAAHETVPAIYAWREYVEAGGLMSYGTSITDNYRQAGVYAARVLKGEKPTELPVIRPTKFELVINLKTAKALGLEVPPTLLARADEVIE